MYRVLVGSTEEKRPLGRPRNRWEDNIKMDYFITCTVHLLLFFYYNVIATFEFIGYIKKIKMNLQEVGWEGGAWTG